MHETTCCAPAPPGSTGTAEETPRCTKRNGNPRHLTSEAPGTPYGLAPILGIERHLDPHARASA
jgi:hypothetical protein